MSRNKIVVLIRELIAPFGAKWKFSVELLGGPASRWPHIFREIRENAGAHCRSLSFPGFPVKGCGFGQLHVVLFRENHISGAGESCEVGNPGTLLGMTKERATFY
jgi:hypothetical protein